VSDERDQVRARTDIVALVQRRVPLKKSGRTWKGLCPFHDDKNPSMQVNPEMGWFHCFACGAKGDVFDWVMRTEHVEFPEALRILAAEAGVELKRHKGPRGPFEAWEAAMSASLAFFRQELERCREAQEYLERRGLDRETVDSWEIGYAPDINGALATHLQKQRFSLAECEKLFLVRRDPAGGYYDQFRGRLMFPIRDERGKLVAFGGRLLGEGQPKYINSSDTPLYSKGRVLYGMHRAREALAGGADAILVEGYLDVIACHGAGVKTALASLGTALADDHARLLKRWCGRVVVLYDQDAAGIKAADRACEVLESAGVLARVAVLPEGDDPDSALKKHGASVVQRAVEESMGALAFRLRTLEGRLDLSDEAFWREASELLAAAKDRLALESEVDRLVGRYPFTRDRAAARAAIQGLVREAKRKRAKPDKAVVATPAAAQRFAVPTLEATVVRGLTRPDLAHSAWEACGDASLFASAQGKALAVAVRQAFPAGPPALGRLDWIPGLEDETLRAFLVRSQDSVDLAPSRELAPLDRQVFDDALAALRRRHEEDERRSLAQAALIDDSKLAELSAALRRRKGGTEQEPRS
jgi:DNA primase